MKNDVKNWVGLLEPALGKLTTHHGTGITSMRGDTDTFYEVFRAGSIKCPDPEDLGFFVRLHGEGREDVINQIDDVLRTVNVYGELGAEHTHMIIVADMGGEGTPTTIMLQQNVNPELFNEFVRVLKQLFPNQFTPNQHRGAAVDLNGATHINRVTTDDFINIEGNQYDMRWDAGEHWWVLSDAAGIIFAHAGDIDAALYHANERYMDGDYTNI